MRIERVLHKRFFLWVASIFCVTFAAAQVKFTAITGNHIVGRADYVQVEFIVENAKQIENLVTPTFPDFKVVEGPIQTSGMSVVNGNTSQYKGISFVLQPLKLGKFTIAAASANVDGRMMHSNTLSIEVNANAPAPANTPSALQPVWPDEPADAAREYILKPGENIADKIKKNLFLKVQVSKTTCYVGEPIVATYKLYSRLRSESRVTKRPSLNGFSVYDMIDPNADAASVETLNGRQFAVHIIRKAQLIPLQAGTVELDPVEVENKVFFIKQNTSNRRRHSLLDDLFGQFNEEGGTETDQNVTLDTKPLAITIKALPELNKPENFNGAVGRFSIDAKIDSKKMNASGSGMLKVTVKGNGNLPIVNAPQVKWPDSVEAYDPTAKEEVDKTVAPMSGSKTFLYAFIPRRQGKYILPPVAFSYFDPSTDTYKNVKSDSLGFDVDAAAKSNNYAVVPEKTSNEGVFYLLRHHLEWFFAVLILAGLAVYLWRQNMRLNKNYSQQKPAHVAPKPNAETQLLPVAAEKQDPLLAAKSFMEAADYPAFYKALNQSLWETLRNSLNLRSTEMNKTYTVKRLSEKGWKEPDIALLTQTLNTCEMNLYTPDYSQHNMQELLKNAEQIVDHLTTA